MSRKLKVSQKEKRTLLHKDDTKKKKTEGKKKKTRSGREKKKEEGTVRDEHPYECRLFECRWWAAGSGFHLPSQLYITKNGPSYKLRKTVKNKTGSFPTI